MSRWLAIPVAFGLIIASGFASGVWDNRWGLSTELASVSRNVADLPLDLGDWKGKDIDQDPDATARLILRGSLHAMQSRAYTNIRTGQRVNVLLATGRPGPISTHNPMTCVVNKAAMSQSSDAINATIDVPPLGPVGYTRCNIRSTSAGGQFDEWTIYWTWHSTKGWTWSDNPRLSFASYRALTKLYVTRQNTEYALGVTKYSEENDPALQFLRDCLPLIEKDLYGRPEAGESAHGA